jgi:cAMP-binding proteins - catabolite gene activator and regulatory subunit of cAMP-dependent protein kinases
MGTVIPLKDLAKQSSARPHCGLAELCLPYEPSARQAENRNGFACSYRRVKRGECLYRTGDPFASVFPVRLGFFKTSVVTAAGGDQVTGFHMRGEIMGFEGVDTGTHSCTAVALEDSLVCMVPFGLFEEKCAANTLLQRQFHRAMSSQIDLRQAAMLMLGTMAAEERVAAYLLDLSERFGARGYSRYEFNLRMTREEIGSFIGLTLETVSRAFARFQKAKLLSIEGKAVTDLDLQGLRQVIGHHVEPN